VGPLRSHIIHHDFVQGVVDNEPIPRKFVRVANWVEDKGVEAWTFSISVYVQIGYVIWPEARSASAGFVSAALKVPLLLTNLLAVYGRFPGATEGLLVTSDSSGVAGTERLVSSVATG